MSNGTQATRPTLGAPSVSDIDKAFAPFQGQTFAGTTDISALDPRSKLTKKGQKKLEEAGISLDEPFDIIDAHEMGLTKGDFRRGPRKDLEGAGLTARKGGALADQGFLERFRFGSQDVFDEGPVGQASQESLDLVTAGLDAAREGLAIAKGELTGPLARDVLNNVNNMFASVFGGRGTGRGGAAALAKTTGGIQALSDVGRNLATTGIGVSSGALDIGTTLNPFISPEFTLGRDDLFFDRRNFNRLFQTERRITERAADLAGSTSQLFKTNFAASSGQSSGNLTGLLASTGILVGAL